MTSASSITAIGSSISLSTFLSRIVAVILGIVAVLSGNGGVTVEITDEVTTESESIVYEIKNTSFSRASAGYSFTLEVESEDEWNAVSFAEGYGFRAVAVVISAFASFTVTVDLNDAFGGPLDAGNYRLTVSVSGTDYSTEFTVVQA
ncbi:MAG: hypothetical protein LUG85_02970 [Clostridiales bacterium]|nr:hypothetical protein [Clostridiales bacterium]